MPLPAIVIASIAVLFGLASAAQAQVSGIVGDLSLVPIEGAIVTLQGTGTRTTTAVDGSFELPDVTGTDAVIVAAKKGFYNASLTVNAPEGHAVIALRPVPQDDDPSYAITDPTVCGSCHPDQLSQWTGSPMSKGGTNTWIHDIFSGTGTAGGMGGFVYLRDSVYAASNPESECASCHQPEVWIGNDFDGAMEDLTSPSAAALHGVSCDVCHKIADIDENNLNYPGIFPGFVTYTRPAGPQYKQVQYGLLGDSDFTAPALMRSSYQPQLEAEVCAACHQDKNDPDEDGDFEEANGVISEPTYHEWADSPFGDEESPLYTTCIDCHMPPSGKTDVCNVLDPPLVRDPETIRSHRIEGTTPYYLENAVEMAMDSRITGGILEVDVDIVNSLTGHHVPTGVTVRNMILVIDAWRDEDSLTLTHTGSQVVHALGGVGSPSLGYYAGLPGKLYAKLNQDALGNAPTFFTDATSLVFDNRIAALATDSTNFTFTVPPGDGTLRVKARLIYRRAWRALVDAKGWTEDGHGNPLADVLPPDYGHLMESVEHTVLAVDCTGQSFGVPCSDGNPCNGDEICDGAGACLAGVPLDCDDTNPCTDDTCVRGTGCSHTNNTGVCDDGDACTTDDLCAAGACTGGPALDCDDYNICTNDGCDSLAGCEWTPASGACEDGDACTTGDSCGGGVCIPGTPLDCSDGNPCTQDTCSALGGCASVEEPAVACLAAAKSSFQIKNSDDDTRDQLKWKWSKGGAFDHTDLDAPNSSTAYALCVYDHAGGESALAARVEIAPSAFWIEKAPKGWVYKDKAGTSDGVQRAQLKAGPAGRSAAKIGARGLAIPMPVPSSAVAMFQQDPGVTIQLLSDETPVCWESAFNAAGTKMNRSDRFKAKAP